MKDYLAHLVALMTTYGAWAGPIVGLLSFGESLAIVGLLIPATAAMLTIGGLIGTGLLDPVPIIGFAIAGAILGDWVSYWIGRRMGPSLYRRWPLNRHRSSVARARLLFRRHGFLAVFLGRFLGPIRATVPLVAGVMKMPRRPFQIANIASASLWVPSLFLPGALAARSVGSSELTHWHIAAMAAIVVGATIGGVLLGGRILGGDRKRKRRNAVRQTAQP